MKQVNDTEQYKILQDQLDRRFNDKQTEFDRRFAALDKKIDHVDSSNQDQLDHRFNEMRYQTETARVATEKRLDGMNEFRDQLRDQAARFIGRDELNVVVNNSETGQARNADAIQRLASRMDLMQGSDSGSFNYRAEHRLEIGQIIQIAVMLIMVASVILVVVHGGG